MLWKKKDKQESATVIFPIVDEEDYFWKFANLIKAVMPIVYEGGRSCNSELLDFAFELPDSFCEVEDMHGWHMSISSRNARFKDKEKEDPMGFSKWFMDLLWEKFCEYRQSERFELNRTQVENITNKEHFLSIRDHVDYCDFLFSTYKVNIMGTENDAI